MGYVDVVGLYNPRDAFGRALNVQYSHVHVVVGVELALVLVGR